MTKAPFVATIIKPSTRLEGAKALWVRWRHVALGVVLGVTLLTAALVTIHVLRTVKPERAHQEESQSAPVVRIGSNYENRDDSVCFLPADPGRCRGGFRMFYYDASIGQCRTFLFGGCRDGNGNRFSSKSHCEQHCGGVTQRQAAATCLQPMEVGMCRGSFPMFFYNSQQDRCVPFTYGGCGGNGNKFNTEEECNQTCLSRSVSEPLRHEDVDDCSSPPDSGLCYAYLERFAFNSSTRKCDKFVYGGCGGNRNRYTTQEECLNACKITTADARIEYDLKQCGMDQCPEDCSQVNKKDGCVYCMCNHVPFVREGEISVSVDQACPENHVETRQDVNYRICIPAPVNAGNDLN